MPSFIRSYRVRDIDLILQKGENPLVDSYSAFRDNDRDAITGLSNFLQRSRRHETSISAVWRPITASSSRPSMRWRCCRASRSASSRMPAAASTPEGVTRRDRRDARPKASPYHHQRRRALDGLIARPMSRRHRVATDRRRRKNHRSAAPAPPAHRRSPGGSRPPRPPSRRTPAPALLSTVLIGNRSSSSSKWCWMRAINASALASLLDHSIRLHHPPPFLMHGYTGHRSAKSIGQSRKFVCSLDSIARLEEVRKFQEE
jgi:hypothetical protein